MLQAHQEFTRKFTTADRLAELADTGPADIRRIVLAIAESARDEALASAELCPSDSERHWITERVIDEAFGMGPLEPLLRHPDGDAIVILGPRDVCLERDGALCETEVVFADQQLCRPATYPAGLRAAA